MSDAADFFRSLMDQMIDFRNPLAVSFSGMPGQELKASVSPPLAKMGRAGRVIDDADLFRGNLEVGRRRCFIRREPTSAATPGDLADMS
jgi:hypothetical protein